MFQHLADIWEDITITIMVTIIGTLGLGSMSLTIVALLLLWSQKREQLTQKELRRQQEDLIIQLKGTRMQRLGKKVIIILYVLIAIVQTVALLPVDLVLQQEEQEHEQEINKTI